MVEHRIDNNKNTNCVYIEIRTISTATRSGFSKKKKERRRENIFGGNSKNC